jgi:hypothetical protein
MRELPPKVERSVQKDGQDVIEARSQESKTFEVVVEPKLMLQNLMMVVRGQEGLKLEFGISESFLQTQSGDFQIM